jgi:competence protein ComEC
MNVWNSQPFVRLLFAFISGLVIAINFPFFPDFSLFIFTIPAIAYLLINHFTSTNYQLKFIKGIPIILFFVLFGLKLVKLNTSINYKHHFSNHINEYYLVKVAESPKHKQNTVKLIAEIIQVKQKENWIQTTGKVLLYLYKDQKSAQIKYGDVLVCNAPITATAAPKNPFEFNYKKYLAFHQIYHQAYIGSTNWLFIGTNQGNPILKFSYEIRNYLLALIAKHHIEGDEYAIGAALILGYEDDLSNEVIGSFAATGALHVLSVSGLHVGIVFLVLNFILQYLGESKTAKITRFLIALSGLWLYALITGLSPSVWRAAAMFSLITIGKFYQRDLNTFNIVGCSAFILLCINPFMITEVGFQLSYLAVIGIIILHKRIYDYLTIKNKILDQIWSITCVSIAAQLVTFPLGLLYFHQFPNYFLISNLVVIPLSTVILYNGILLLVTAKISVVGAIVAKVLNTLLWVLKIAVAFFEKLPFAIINGIAITTFDTIIIYGILISLYSFWLYKKLQFLNLSLALCAVLLTFQIIEKLEQQSQEKMIIYAINKHTAIDFISGQQSSFIADAALLKSKDKMRFHLTPHWNAVGIEKTYKYCSEGFTLKPTYYLSSNGHYLFYKNKTILNTTSQFTELNELIYKPEIIVLNKINNKKFKDLFKLFPDAEYICDGTISINYYQKIKQNNPFLKIRSVLDEGAITLKV